MCDCRFFVVQGGAAAEGLEDEAAADSNKEEADARSVFVNNVDYGTTPEELQQLFAGCGTVNRVTILADKFGTPKVSTSNPPSCTSQSAVQGITAVGAIGAAGSTCTSLQPLLDSLESSAQRGWHFLHCWRPQHSHPSVYT